VSTVPASTPGAGGSAAPLSAHGSMTPEMSGHAWGPLRREWIKLLFQRRSYLIWAGMLAIPFLASLAIKLAGSGPNANEGPAFLSRVLGNGMYVPLASLSALLPFLLPMAASMVASYMVAGEAELGTLRIILLRPVKRGSMLVSKWIVAMLYLAVGFLLVLVGGVVFGGLFFGLHPMITLSGTTLSVAHGLGLTVLVFLYGLAAMSCMVSLALLFSVLTDSSLTALIGAVIFYIVVQIVIAFSYFAWLRPWVFPNYFLEYVSFFRDPIYWTPILKGLASFGVWSFGLTFAAYVLFRRKDVLS
jgi:ABC-2 type transport system permease protein